MTDREKAIVEAYTGFVMLTGDKAGVFYKYVEEKLGHPIMTHELASKVVQEAIKNAAKDDFIELCKNCLDDTEEGGEEYDESGSD